MTTKDANAVLALQAAVLEIERLRAELARVQAYIDETPDLFEALGPIDCGPNDPLERPYSVRS